MKGGFNDPPNPSAQFRVLTSRFEWDCERLCEGSSFWHLFSCQRTSKSLNSCDFERCRAFVCSPQRSHHRIMGPLVGSGTDTPMNSKQSLPR